MLPTDLIRHVAETCRALKLDYFFVGSVASSRYGETRYTKDVDVVVEIPSWKVREFCAAFPAPRFHADEHAARYAAETCTQFNIIDVSTGFKVDVMVMDDRPYTESQRARAREIDLIPGSTAFVAAPEDVILMKLVFYKEGQSDKHLRDIASMMKISGDQIDRGYVERWAPRLGVSQEWGAMVERLGLPPGA
ncbi:MAG TPA: hypothetical protein VG797_11050 [Phycisphaerales bacterium]|nr:hypothetical protein [Phycisphaerales bacterium]